RVGFYGFFECIDDPAAARALFDTAATWLRARGLRVMRGPMSPSINDECGLLVEGFDTPPTLMMPHNPPYYVGLHAGSGLAERQGEVIGFAVALPDFNVALKHNPSGRLYGLPKILWYARKIRRCRILLLGTVKAYRMSGVDALMYHWIWTKGATHGYHWGEGG